MDIRDDLKCSNTCRNLCDRLITEYYTLKEENKLLKEELKELKDGIIGIYNNMNALEIINKHEMEDIEEI